MIYFIYLIAIFCDKLLTLNHTRNGFNLVGKRKINKILLIKKEKNPKNKPTMRTFRKIKKNVRKINYFC